MQSSSSSSELPQLSASLLPPKPPPSTWPEPTLPLALCHPRSLRWRLRDSEFPHSTVFFLHSSFILMASSARFVSSLRRTALSSRVPARSQYLRPAFQVRWNGSTPTPTSATSEPHQPDAEGGVKGKTAPAKTIKFTSESFVALNRRATNKC
jgi:hypothetical protein